MIDISLIRNEPDAVREALRKRMDTVDLQPIQNLDAARRELITSVEQLKARRNDASREVPRIKRAGGDATELIAEMRAVGDRIKELETRLGTVTQELDELLAGLPNLPDPDVPPGGKEANQTLREWGERPAACAAGMDHVAFAGRLGLVDYERGAKLAGHGFWIYRGWGARLEWALLNYFIDTHVADGFELILPPHLLSYVCGFNAGQFPRFGVDDVYFLQEGAERGEAPFLLPTSETALASLHADEILKESEMPKRYVAYTPCYRREAGSYRTHDRGTLRGHQFNKVELFQFVMPDRSEEALEDMIGRAERLVQGLGLHYRVTRLAAGDASSAMARTLDLEVYLPSTGSYEEVSSASNARDYQTRRANTRVRGSGGTRFVHTLNASGLATSRLLPALLETHQNADGTLTVPEPLRPALGTDRVPTGTDRVPTGTDRLPPA